MTVSFLPLMERICCCDGECDCLGDCNDYEAPGSENAASCMECCWSPGDAIRFKHIWGQSSEVRRETQYGGLTPFGCNGAQCADVTYQGGGLEVEYVAFGCSIDCPLVNPGRVKILFGLNTSFGDVYFDEGLQSYAVAGPGWKYSLQQNLALTCQSVNNDGTGAGDYQWHWYSSCDLPFQIPVCVTPCRVGCQDVQYETCDGSPTCPYCNGAAGIPVNGPDFSNCEHCVDAVADCGGLRAYCAYRWVTSECAKTGNAYGQFMNPSTGVIECGYGCEPDAEPGQFHPVQVCEMAYFQTLELLPPPGATRQCRWHEWVANNVAKQCCREAAVEGGEEISLPDPITAVVVPDQSWPTTGWTQVGPDPCDCFQSPIQPASCAEWECPAITSLVATGAKAVCNP